MNSYLALDFSNPSGRILLLLAARHVDSVWEGWKGCLQIHARRCPMSVMISFCLFDLLRYVGGIEIPGSMAIVAFPLPKDALRHASFIGGGDQSATNIAPLPSDHVALRAIGTARTLSGAWIGEMNFMRLENVRKMTG